MLICDMGYNYYNCIIISIGGSILCGKKGGGGGGGLERTTLDLPLIIIYPDGCFGVMCDIAVCRISHAHRALSQNTHTD